jgi:RHS repeat-associated protein
MGFGYDANGRQVKATRTNFPDAATVYDALGNRVATKIDDVWRYMVYDAFGQLVAEYGQASEGTGGVKYVQQDWQGSVRAVTNGNGFVVARTDHQAFGGEIGAGTGQRSIDQGYGVDKVAKQAYGLTETDDATGQQHAWFRKLETQAGRWTSPDLYKGSMSVGDPQSFNRYSYVQDQPTNFVDPSGLLRISCEVRGPDSEGGTHLWLQCNWVDDRWHGYGFPDRPILGGTGDPTSKQPPKIDDQKLKDCIKEKFNTTTNSYNIGSSYRGSSPDARMFIISLLIDLFGGDGNAVSVDTTSLLIRDLENKVYGPLGMRGDLPAGFTDRNDPQHNFVANDYGNNSFQESIWVYELGNSLGHQTGNHPVA